MRLFVSYARVDKPYCVQIVSILDAHESWYDQRLYAGQNWWKEILRRLDWCEGFIYLLSPESVVSEYCQRELELAMNLGKAIFPMLIYENTPLPALLAEMQYADLSRGLTVEAVKMLLNAIYIAEQQHQTQPVNSQILEEAKLPPVSSGTAISSAVTAMQNGQFDQAVFLLRQAKSTGFTSRFINIDKLLSEAEIMLEQQSQTRELEREYRLIAELVKYPPTTKVGREAFEAFHAVYPEYDPQGLKQICSEPYVEPKVEKISLAVLKPPFSVPMLEWCSVPPGQITVTRNDEDGPSDAVTYFLDGFKMSRYPITNAQYQLFLDDPRGYADSRWWDFSTYAHAWRLSNPHPKTSSFKGVDRPREMVNWYDAVAFCRWLSDKLDMETKLPSVAQWQRAARGDDNRLYPWGNMFDRDFANTRESDIRMTTTVMRYKEGISPFDIFDMVGNVWEWCVNIQPGHEDCADMDSPEKRVVQGGSFVSVYQRAQIPFYYSLDPQIHYGSIGFRIVGA